MVRAVYISGAFLPLYLFLTAFLAIVVFTATYGHHSSGVPERVTYIIDHLQPDVIEEGVRSVCSRVCTGTLTFFDEKLDTLLDSKAGKAGQLLATSGAVTASYASAFAAGVGRFLWRRALGIYEELAPRPLTWLLTGLWEGGWAASAALKAQWEASQPALQAAAHRVLQHLDLNDTVAAYVALSISLVVGSLIAYAILLVPAKRFVRNAFMEELRLFEERLGQRIHVRGVAYCFRKSEMVVTEIVVGNPRQFTYMAGFLLKATKVRLHLRRLRFILGSASASRFAVERAVLQYKPGLKEGSPSNVSIALNNVRDIQQACGVASEPPPGALDEKRRDESRRSFEIHVPCVLEDSEVTGAPEIMCSVLEQTLEECMSTWAHQRLKSFDELQAEKEKDPKPEEVPASK
eukprot:EG_transcript_11695